MCVTFLTGDKVSRKKNSFRCYDDPVLAVGRSGIGPGPLYILDPSFRLRRAEFRLKRFFNLCCLCAFIQLCGEVEQTLF